MAELLLQHGARVNLEGGLNHHTPLYIACLAGKVETARTLLAHGADVNAADDYRDTPLHVAVRGNRKDLVKLLLTTNVNLNLESRGGTKMQPAFDFSGEFQGEIGGTPLHIAIQGKHKEIAALLKAKGAIDTGRDLRGWHPSGLPFNPD